MQCIWVSVCVCAYICYSLHSVSLQTEYIYLSVYINAPCSRGYCLRTYQVVLHRICASIYFVAGKIALKAPDAFEFTMHTRISFTAIRLQPNRTRLEYLHSHLHVCVCLYESLYNARYMAKARKKRENKQVRAENNMQKHKIIVVVKSFVHNTEWQRNYQV